MDEVKKIIESKEDIRDKTSKILELDFSDSDVDYIAETIINLYEDAYDEIDITKEEIEEDIREISYRNLYLSMSIENKDSKKEDAINQKDKFIKKIQRLIRNKTKGLKENKGESVMKPEEEPIIVEEAPVIREEDIKEENPSTIVYPEIIDDTKDEKTIAPIYEYTPVNNVSPDNNYSFVESTPSFNYMSGYTDDSLSLTEQINRVKARMRAIEAEEIRKLELEYKKRNIVKNYEKRKQEILMSLENEMKKELAAVDYEMNNLGSKRAI